MLTNTIWAWTTADAFIARPESHEFKAYWVAVANGPWLLLLFSNRLPRLNFLLLGTNLFFLCLEKWRRRKNVARQTICRKCGWPNGVDKSSCRQIVTSIGIEFFWKDRFVWYWTVQIIIIAFHPKPCTKYMSISTTKKTNDRSCRLVRLG